MEMCSVGAALTRADIRTDGQMEGRTDGRTRLSWQVMLATLRTRLNSSALNLMCG